MAKDYSHKIKKLRMNLGLTQHALADQVGVRPATVGWWETGLKEPSAESYVRLARLSSSDDAWFFLNKLGIDKELVLTKWSDATNKPLAPQPPEIRIYTMEEWKSGTLERLRFQVQIPVLRDEAAAGSPREINERDIDSFIAVPIKFVPKGSGAYTGIYIRGDSMEPILSDRFIVVVDHTQRDLVRLRGRMVAALVQDGVLVKWLARESRRDRLIFRSQNPAYADITLEALEMNPIIGDVVFWWGIQKKGSPGAR